MGAVAVQILRRRVSFGVHAAEIKTFFSDCTDTDGCFESTDCFHDQSQGLNTSDFGGASFPIGDYRAMFCENNITDAKTLVDSQ